MENNFEKLTGVVPLKIAEVNDYVQFGAFAWQVIAIENGNKLLLSKECMQIDMDWVLRDEDAPEAPDYIANMLSDILAESNVDYSEEYNNLKEYFKEWFCKKYFSESDIARIIPRNADELVFILSVDEADRYLPNKETRSASFESTYKCPWLLRVDGVADYEVIVCSDGEIEKVPEGQLCDKFRPAVWIK
jgi:hypothetical protein